MNWLTFSDITLVPEIKCNIDKIYIKRDSNYNYLIKFKCIIPEYIKLPTKPEISYKNIRNFVFFKFFKEESLRKKLSG